MIRGAGSLPRSRAAGITGRAGLHESGVVTVATWADVRRIALALPGTCEKSSRGLPQWRVRDKLFAWERPLRRADLEALGGDAPDGEILGARTADLGVKEALIADNPEVYFTTPHFGGYPAILVRLEQITTAELGELITEAWLARAPKRLAGEYLHGSLGGQASARTGDGREDHPFRRC
jgi:hypothetical protein